jgi:hypothetical protein
MKGRILEVVGASGFEPPTSWSRTIVSKILSRFGGVTYGPKPLFFEPLIEPKLNLTRVGVTQAGAGFCWLGYHALCPVLVLPRQDALDGDGLDLFSNPFLFKEAVEG